MEGAGAGERFNRRGKPPLGVQRPSDARRGSYTRLFAIGEEAFAEPDDLPPERVELVLRAAEEHLGVTELPDGRCIVWWKLMYARGDRLP